MRSLTEIKKEAAALSQRIAQGKAVLADKRLELAEAQTWQRKLAEDHAANPTPPASYRLACEKVAVLKADVEGREHALVDMTERVAGMEQEHHLTTKAMEISTGYRGARDRYRAALARIGELLPRLEETVALVKEVEGVALLDMRVLHSLARLVRDEDLAVIGHESIVEHDEFVMDSTANKTWTKGQVEKLVTMNAETQFIKLKETTATLAAAVDSIVNASFQFDMDKMTLGIGRR